MRNRESSHKARMTVFLTLSTMSSVMLIACGWQSNSVEARIVNRINQQCGKAGDCIIRIREVTPFDWDKMYVFTDGAAQGEVDKALGVPFPNYTEFTRKIVFMNRGVIVYSEELP